MAVKSKSAKKANPNLTRTGKVRFKMFGVQKLKELIEKSNRPRDTDKLTRRLNQIA